jgi:uncharacterized hydantoinase/oxoprolinase family protein
MNRDISACGWALLKRLIQPVVMDGCILHDFGSSVSIGTFRECGWIQYAIFV